MNLSDINWDFEASGTWPFPVKAGVIAILCILLAGAGYYYDTMTQLEELDLLEKKEVELKATFSNKQRKAINLPEYVEQLKQIEQTLGEMIKQMPTDEEVASLLVDISQTGLASGLEFRLFKPAAAVSQDFYSELPIDIQVVGHYEELGLFVSGLASLPRIVTVHNVAIKPLEQSGKEKTADAGNVMIMDAVVKTYKEEVNKKPVTDNKRRKGVKK